MICPKCNHNRVDMDDGFPKDECPRCGIIYDKFNPNLNEEKSKLSTDIKKKFSTKSSTLHNILSSFTTKTKKISPVLIPIMILICFCYIIFNTMILEFLYSNEIKLCHDSVYKQAKYSAEIISTNISKSSLISPLCVRGRAKLQNGFGAWTQYEYFGYVSKGDRSVYMLMTKGWD